MITLAWNGVMDGIRTAWDLRWPFVFSHLLFQLVSGFIMAPLVAWLILSGVRLSGEPALTDFAIAGYLLSPLGLIVLVVVASVVIARAVLDIAFMMAIAHLDRQNGHAGFLDGARFVLPRFLRLVDFSGQLFVRVLIVAAPFALAALFVASKFLGDYDINYYLTDHPPEFWIAAVLIGLILLAFLAVGLPLLTGWVVALPLIMFSGVSPRKSFKASRAHMEGKRWGTLVLLVAWIAIVSSVGSALFGILYWGAEAAASAFGRDLKTIAAILLVFGILFGVATTFFTSIATGALAVIFCDLAGWPERAKKTDPEAAKFSRVAGLTATAVLLATATVAIAGLWKSEVKRDPGDVVVIAHRGAAGSRPENTMASMEKGIEDGADFLELDVQESADDEVIVMHDSDYMKLSGVNLKAWEATRPELSEIDIGSWFDPAYADERTPALRDVLELSRDKSKVLIELKYYGHDKALEERVAEVVEDTAMADQIEVMSLKYEGVQKMKALRPDWNVGLLLTAAIGDVWELETDFLAVNAAMATPALIASSHAVGKPIYVWTINDAITMTRMIDLGVDGLITDEPDLAREVLAQITELNPLEQFVLSLSDVMGISIGSKEYRDGSP